MGNTQASENSDAWELPKKEQITFRTRRKLKNKNGTLGVFTNLVSLGMFLKCLADTSEEACDADGVYAVLQKQRWGDRFEN